MSKIAYDQASVLQKIISEQARGVLGRLVGSGLKFDRNADEWVVRLTVTRKVSEDEAHALLDLGVREGIRVEWLDEMQPARLAVG